MGNKLLKEVLERIASGEDLSSVFMRSYYPPAEIYFTLQRFLSKPGSRLLRRVAARHKLNRQYILDRVEQLLSQIDEFRETNPYTVLGLTHLASPSEIHQRWKHLLSLWHPDRREGDMHSYDVTLKVNEAYRVLKSKELREGYDKENAILLTIAKDIGDHGRELKREKRHVRGLSRMMVAGGALIFCAGLVLYFGYYGKREVTPASEVQPPLQATKQKDLPEIHPQQKRLSHGRGEKREVSDRKTTAKKSVPNDLREEKEKNIELQRRVASLSVNRKVGAAFRRHKVRSVRKDELEKEPVRIAVRGRPGIPHYRAVGSSRLSFPVVMAGGGSFFSGGVVSRPGDTGALLSGQAVIVPTVRTPREHPAPPAVKGLGYEPESVIEAFVKYYREGNCPRLISLFEEDAVQNGIPIKLVEKNYAVFFKSLKVLRFDFVKKETRRVPGKCEINGYYVSEYRKANGKEAFRDEGDILFVLAKSEGKQWRIVKLDFERKR